MEGILSSKIMIQSNENKNPSEEDLRRGLYYYDMK